MKAIKPEDGKRYIVQFIKNWKGNIICKSFRKYNLVEAVYCDNKKDYRSEPIFMHYTKYNLHFIKPEYVKIYKEL